MKNRRSDKDGEVTIVKRRGKKHAHEEGSGAWKVAFADFTLAMMALFMVLWVVQPMRDHSTPAQGDQQSNPLVDGGVSVFDGTSRTPMELERVELPVPRKAERHTDAVKRYGSPEELKQLAELMRVVAAEVDALANLEVNVVPQGLRILIKDDQQRFMFQRGSAVLDPHFRGLLEVLAGVLAKVDNKLIISGHTDAVPYARQSGYDNWNLSGDRALRARSALVEAGLRPNAVLQVTAQADVMPLRPEEPTHGANRRIEILLLTESAEKLYRELFGESYVRADFSPAGARLVRASAAPVE